MDTGGRAGSTPGHPLVLFRGFEKKGGNDDTISDFARSLPDLQKSRLESPGVPRMCG